MNEKPAVQPIRETTEDALTEARRLIAEAKYGALATLAPEDGSPMASRVLLAPGPDGVPMILASRLSAHSGALRADPRCSLLIGEVGKGDPLAYARLTLSCRAAERPRSDDLRTRFLDAQPKARLYIDLPDFAFFALVPDAVSYVAGFGRAYRFNWPQLVQAPA